MAPNCWTPTLAQSTSQPPSVAATWSAAPSTEPASPTSTRAEVVGTPKVPGQLDRRPLRRGLVDVEHGDAHAHAGERPRHRRAEPGRATGDHCHLAPEVHAVSLGPYL